MITSCNHSENKALHKALKQECSDLETLIEEIRETT